MQCLRSSICTDLDLRSWFAQLSWICAAGLRNSGAPVVSSGDLACTDTPCTAELGCIICTSLQFVHGSSKVGIFWQKMRLLTGAAWQGQSPGLARGSHNAQICGL